MRVPTSSLPFSPYSASTPFDIFYFSVFRPNENYKRYRGQYNYRDKFEPTNKFQRRVASLREKKKKRKKKLQLNRGEWKIGGGGFHRWNVSRNRISYIEPCYIYVFYIYIYIYFLVRFSPRFIIETLWKRYGNSKREGNGGWTQLREVNTRRSVRNYERSGGSPRRFISNLFRKSRRHLDTFNLPR